MKIKGINNFQFILHIMALRKNSVNLKTVIKTLCCERLENSRSNFFRVYPKICVNL